MNKFIFLLWTLLLTACFDQSNNSPSSNQPKNTGTIPAVHSVNKEFANQQRCIEVKNSFTDNEPREHCARLYLASQSTNIHWINQELDEMILSDFNSAKTPEQTLEQKIEKWFVDGMEFIQENVGLEIERTVQYLGQRHNIATFREYFFEYSGGVHGNYYTKFINFDLNSHRILNIDDLLISPEKRSELLQKWREANAKRQAESVFSDWDSSAAGLSENFYFTHDGLMFRYGVYELAPFVAGEVDVIIPYYELQNIIKPEFLY